jgi:hypothetical protein
MLWLVGINDKSRRIIVTEMGLETWPAIDRNSSRRGTLVGNLAAGEQERDRSAQAIGQCVDLSGASAA